MCRQYICPWVLHLRTVDKAVFVAVVLESFFHKAGKLCRDKSANREKNRHFKSVYGLTTKCHHHATLNHALFTYNGSRREQCTDTL